MPQKFDAELLDLDKRIASRKVLLGEVSEKELQNLLKKLPDVADNAEEVSLDENENSFLCLLIPTPIWK
ncbi:hypothetical protein ER57_14645 [Smithella sp. SCADC]|jgi:hypothetical protein|nr:hypothetical protein ER57_14645 [Smithella sp. SCADC]